MAVRPRVIAAPATAPTNNWPWHSLSTKLMSVLSLASGDRRLEAGTYLSEGHGLRQGFVGTGEAVGWQKLGELARVWQPSRLKGITVSRKFGTPFLAATQVFDVRPAPRKWLSLDRTDDADNRFLDHGMTVVTCSGSVGRATLAYAAHDKILISHDLLRVAPNDSSRAGWIYAYLRSPQGRAMMTGEEYGHMIKHLEPTHLESLPVPDISDQQAQDFQTRMEEVLEHRNRSWQLRSQAEKRFDEAVGSPGWDERAEQGFRVPIQAFSKGRRRLEASYHSPKAAEILHLFGQSGVKVEKLGSVTDRIWMMDRFKRNYGPSGISYLSADQLFTLNPEVQKRIVVTGRDEELYFAKPNWLLMARSGQVYGLNGSVYLVTDAHSDTFFSDDLIRIRPKDGGPRAGYLATALTHPTLGRPLLIREAYGTSIPHLDPVDVEAFPLVRLTKKMEDEIADLAEESAAERSQADVKENKLGDDAGIIVASFLQNVALGSVAV